MLFTQWFQVTNCKCHNCFLCTTYIFSHCAEQADIELCDKIMQLHPDFCTFMHGLSQDDETDGFNLFLSMVSVLYVAYMHYFGKKNVLDVYANVESSSRRQ